MSRSGWVLGWLAVGCDGPKDPGRDGTTGDTGAVEETDTVEETGSVPAECTDPDTVIQGDSTVSRTLQAACSPYQLAGVTYFYGEGVELVVEPGVVVLAQADARLEVQDGARLLAGAAGGAEVVFETDPAAAGPWAGLVLHSAEPLAHELHEVTLRGAYGTPDPEGADAALTLLYGGAVLDAVRVEAPLDVGIRVRREGAWIAPGSRDIVVVDAGSYPMVMDAQNYPGLPPQQDLGSLDPDTNRVLLFGGDEGLIVGDVVWPSQAIPAELATTLSIGTDQDSGSLTLPTTGTILMRHDIHTAFGTFTAVGEDPGCKDDVSRCTLVIDAAEPGTLWGSLIFAATASGPTSRIANARIANGGNNESMIRIISSTLVGEADCGTGTTVEDNWLESTAVCVSVTDSSNLYDADNSLHGCSADLNCD